MGLAAREPRTLDITQFDPSAERAKRVAARMQARLGDSLRYIAETASGQIAVPRAELDGFFERLRRGPVSPLIFGAYCDLVLALEADRLEEAERLFAEIAAAPNLNERLRVMALANPAQDAGAERYRRLADTDAAMALSIVPPSAEGEAGMRAHIEEALALIARGNAELGAELSVLLREIVIAAPAPDSNLSFGGVSSYMLFGSVILAEGAYDTVLDMVQALAHESGHNLLFGLCADGPLHGNADDDRFPSPLREDKRPIDGIVHATYVTARMHQAVGRLMAAGVLDREQMDEARRSNAANVRCFADGMETIARHARLTPLGERVMGNAAAYMAAFKA